MVSNMEDLQAVQPRLHDRINLRPQGEGEYLTSWHPDFCLGPTLHGGYIAAMIHLTAETHIRTDPKIKKLNQPDVLKFQVQFLRPGVIKESTLRVQTIKVGALVSTFQVTLTQEGKERALAICTSVNFDISVGPTAATAWRLEPPPPPIPDFAAVEAWKAEPNWLPARIVGEVLPITGRIIWLDHKAGYPVDGLFNLWRGYRDTSEVENGKGEHMDGTYLALVADLVPSMADTLLENGGLYDARSNFKKIRDWAGTHPGLPCDIRHTLKEAMKADHLIYTVSLDYVFTKRVTPLADEDQSSKGADVDGRGDGRWRWVFMRAVTRALSNGKMDVKVVMCDKNMEVVCEATHMILVLDGTRKWATGVKASL